MRLLTGDCRVLLPTLEAESVQCCVTSPPYWGLRDYGVEGQLGLERTPEEYVANLVAVFRDVRRVLREDGTLWLVIGDSYARTQEGNVPQTKNTPVSYPTHTKAGSSDGMVGRADRPGSRAGAVSLKPKDLVGIPWRVGFALQADGWWLRSDIIWHKPNPMPESVRDRPTKAHEYIFLLTKAERYYYDADAIQEEGSGRTAGNRTPVARRNAGIEMAAEGHGIFAAQQRACNYRNARSVWTIATTPFAGAHFATFPPALVERCIKAGSREGDVVLDPFAGAGTTGAVAASLNRDFIGIELNPTYVADIATPRIALAERHAAEDRRQLPLLTAPRPGE